MVEIVKNWKKLEKIAQNWICEKKVRLISEFSLADFVYIFFLTNSKENTPKIYVQNWTKLGETG